MLKKIISITNVGKLVDCRPVGDVEFRKLTLIYAENGRGKTTLCDVLRSLQTGQPEYIAGRKTLGGDAEPMATIRLDGTTATFSNTTWSTTYSDFAIYDSTFVHENIYAGDYVDHEHKKNLYRVIVGEEGVKLAHHVDRLDTQTRASSRDISGAKAEVMKYVPEGVRLDTFLPLAPDAAIDAKIATKSTEVNALTRASDIASKSLLSKVVLPSIPTDFSTLLAKELNRVSADAEARVQQQVAKHMDEHGETWLAQGVEYVRDETCPFCGQTVEGNVLLESYRTFFGEAYKDLKTEIVSLEGRLSRTIGDTALLAIQRIIANNQTLCEFWKQFVPAQLPELSFETNVQPKLAALRDAAGAAVKRKLGAPLEAITPGKDFVTASEQVKALQGVVETYNAAIDKMNASIATQKTSTAGNNLAGAKKELLVLQATKRRHEAEAAAACRTYQDHAGAKARLEEEKTKAKQQLDAYTNRVFAQYEAQINRYLELFNAGFRITNTTRSYIGGRPSSSYRLLINDVPVNLGDSETPLAEACFKNTLSAGDRSTLALGFFLAQLDQDPRLSDLAVILDDPFTSQDASRRTCTQQLICGLRDRAKQVIVLSHSPAFLKLVWDDAPAGDVKTLQLFRLGKHNTTISEWDIEDETRGDYFQNHAVLSRFLSEGTGDRRRVAQAIRPVLEKYLRFKLPRQFANADWLGGFISTIRDAAPGTPPHAAKVILDEVQAINDYSKKYHHDQNPGGFDTEPIDDGELQAYVKRTLDVVGGF